MEEEWRTIIDWPDYTISNFGRVYSSRRNRILKPGVSKKGRLSVGLCKDSYIKNFYVHRLVALAFVPGYFEGAEVNHKNGINSDNMASNLEWITSEENKQHAIDMGLTRGQFYICLNELNIRFLSVLSCARHIGGKPEEVLKCLNKKQRSYKGYTFKYMKKGK